MKSNFDQHQKLDKNQSKIGQNELKKWQKLALTWPRRNPKWDQFGRNPQPIIGDR